MSKKSEKRQSAMRDRHFDKCQVDSQISRLSRQTSQMTSGRWPDTGDAAKRAFRAK